MAKTGEVLSMLCPNVEYIAYGDDFANIEWLGKESPITKKQFEDGFAKYDAWKAEQDQIKLSEKENILDKLGLTADELQTILG
jgi:hypothetical protein